MNRRDALRLTGTALLGTFVPAWTPTWPASWARPRSDGRLFFSADEVPRIQAAARAPLLQPLFEAWRAQPLGTIPGLLQRVREGGDLLGDFGQALIALQQQGIVHVIAPEPARRDMLLRALEEVAALPKWDYFLDGDVDIGIMRSSLATTGMLLAREALGDDLPPSLEAALLQAVADKGAAPCDVTIRGMDDPATVVGWRFDDRHADTYSLSLARWPEILGANNLRAIPTMGLGLGALALLGRDPRAEGWLDRAVQSARTFLGFFSPDGSYFEGLSYVDYALRSLLPFLEAHHRVQGTVDWVDEAPFHGVVAFTLGMQAGFEADDETPEIVNFSDARGNVSPAIPAWVARHTGDPLAQYTARAACTPGYFADFLWYTPGQPEAPPPPSLLNQRYALDWIVCRTGWGPRDSVLAFRSGGPANHEHADRNSFLWTVYGERLLADPYGAAYDWRQARWALRQTSAHNAVLLGGRGHQYHNGEEGTNESLARAAVVRYVDRGDVVAWTSDATPAYALVHPQVRRVQRSLLFAKPNVVIVLDEVAQEEGAQPVSLRYHPDNRDAAAVLRVAGPDTFEIARPRARLLGRVAATTPFALDLGAIPLPDDPEQFPFVNVAAPAAAEVAVLTVLVAEPAGGAALPPPAIMAVADGWDVEAAGRRYRVRRTGALPELTWRPG